MAKRSAKKQKERLFKEKLVPAKAGSGELFDVSYGDDDPPVECFGMTFENDAARRDHFLNLLKDKLQDPDFRKIEGFPIGDDEDILSLADPPFYTPCPNPFLSDYIRHLNASGDRDNADYHREPFAADVSEGKNNPLYNAHSYHTKVPHKAIMRYLLHYTEPGDLVLDAFCGTGMTGVAGELCASRAEVSSLGYTVEDDGTISDEEKQRVSSLGSRNVIQSDLAPAATFIAANYTSALSASQFSDTAKRILDETEEECGWLYSTLHDASDEQIKQAIDDLSSGRGTSPDDLPWGLINHTIWSDVFVCPECAQELVFWDAAIDHDDGNVLSEFPCPHCNARLTKRIVETAWHTRMDFATGSAVKQKKQVPVLVNYTYRRRRYNKRLDMYDWAVLERCDNSSFQHWFPAQRMLLKDGRWGDLQRAGVHAGVTNIHHFYTRRNLMILSSLWSRIGETECVAVKRRLAFAFTAIQRSVSRLAGIAFSYYFHGGGGAINAGTKGTLYTSSAIPEVNVFHSYRSRVKDVSFSVASAPGHTVTNTSSP